MCTHHSKCILGYLSNHSTLEALLCSQLPTATKSKGQSNQLMHIDLNDISVMTAQPILI